MPSLSARLVFAFCLTAWPLAVVAAPPKPATAPADPRAFVLPEINFDNNSLGDVMDFLRDVVPGFKVVIKYDDPSRTDYPKVSLRLKQCSLAQILDVMGKAYPIEIEQVGAARETDGEILLVRVHGPPDNANGRNGPAVHVYFLGAVLEQLRSRSEKGQKDTTMNQLLSLINATLHQVEGGTSAVIQVHEETKTLIFKGTTAEQIAVEDVLGALDPDWAKTVGLRDAAEKTKLDREKAREFQATIEKVKADAEQQVQRAAEQVSEMRSSLEETHAMLKQRQAESMQRMEEIERLRIRLEAMDATAKPKPTAGKE